MRYKKFAENFIRRKKFLSQKGQYEKVGENFILGKTSKLKM